MGNDKKAFSFAPRDRNSGSESMVPTSDGTSYPRTLVRMRAGSDTPEERFTCDEESIEVALVFDANGRLAPRKVRESAAVKRLGN